LFSNNDIIEGQILVQNVLIQRFFFQDAKLFDFVLFYLFFFNWENIFFERNSQLADYKHRESSNIGCDLF